MIDQNLKSGLTMLCVVVLLLTATIMAIPNPFVPDDECILIEPRQLIGRSVSIGSVFYPTRHRLHFKGSIEHSNSQCTITEAVSFEEYEKWK